MTDTTHSPVCWDWGPKHYECALKEIERMEKALKDIRSISHINSAMNQNPFTLVALLAEIHYIADTALGAWG
jgi:hypothetical protein